jgi:hypothetical protein
MSRRIRKFQKSSAETKRGEQMSRQDERYNEILGVFTGNDLDTTLITSLVREMVYLETELGRLRALPMLLYSPKNPALQRQTPAAKTYALMVSRYADIVNRLQTMIRRAEIVEDSPLRSYLDRLND